MRYYQITLNEWSIFLELPLLWHRVCWCGTHYSAHPERACIVIAHLEKDPESTAGHASGGTSNGCRRVLRAAVAVAVAFGAAATRDRAIQCIQHRRRGGRRAQLPVERPAGTIIIITTRLPIRMD